MQAFDIVSWERSQDTKWQVRKVVQVYFLLCPWAWKLPWNGPAHAGLLCYEDAQENDKGYAPYKETESTRYNFEPSNNKITFRTAR